MPLYHYRAINPRGHSLRGSLTAVDERDLAQRLAGAGLELIAARIKKTGRALWQGKAPDRDLIQLTLHLAEVQRAGIPLLDGLADIRETTAHPQLRDALAEIQREVAEGQPLSAAFARQQTVFGPLFPSLIRAGEETGNLADAFARLRQHVEWQSALRKRLVKATAYPAFLLLLAISVVTFMMVAVVPQVVEFLRATTDNLPPLTRAIIFVSEAVSQSWWIVAILLTLAAAGVTLSVRLSSRAAYRLDALLLHLPALGGVLRKLALARFAHHVSLLFKSGLDLLSALAAARETMGNRALAESIATVEESIRVGQPLSESMRRAGTFPPLVLRLVKVGEDTGALTATLEQVAQFYDREAEDAIATAIATLEPALTLAVGGIMIWIVLAVITPIYDNLGALMQGG